MASPRLKNSLLSDLKDDLKDTQFPEYSRDQLRAGIVHLGVGAFHRAHQATYTEQVLGQGDMRWGTIGASLQSTSTRDALAPQDYLYSLCMRDQDRTDLQVLGGLVDILTDQAKIISAIADPDVHIVTLTITEKGYEKGAVAPSVLAAALARRMESRAPLTVLSCDNLTGNGDVLGEAVRAHCTDRGLISWVDDHVGFPNTMVDRIVPRTTARDRSVLESLAGFTDASPVVCEPFCQWVIEDEFRTPRPEWELAGATFVKDVSPYEQAKLRLLNASHSLLAYLGLLKGYEFIHEAIADTGLRSFLLQTLQLEVRPQVLIPAHMDADAYIESILRRFANRAVPYRTTQVASDGSHKMRQRIYPTLNAIWSTGAAAPRLELTLCAWLRTLAERTKDGTPNPEGTANPNPEGTANPNAANLGTANSNPEGTANSKPKGTANSRSNSGTANSYDDLGAAQVRELVRNLPNGRSLIRAIATETDHWRGFPPSALGRLERVFDQLTHKGLDACLESLARNV